MPLTFTSLTNEVYDANEYAIQLMESITTELATRNTVRTGLQKQRDAIVQATMQAAQTQNIGYVQQIKAAWGDLVELNSTVPVVVEQDPATVANDDVLQATTAASQMVSSQYDVSGNAAAVKEQINTFANLQKGDPSIVAGAIAANANALGNGALGTLMTGDLKGIANDASTLARMDCSKEAALALAKDAGMCFAEGIWTNLNQGTLTPNVLLANFDANLAALGNAFADYVGAAAAGLPGANNCATSTLTNYALGCAAVMNTIEKSATFVNGLASFGIALADQAADIYMHGPDLLIAMAESTAQTAANTALMAVRNAAKTNCTIAFAVNAAQSTLAVGETVLEAGIACVNTATELKGSVDTLVNTVKNTDFVADLKKKVNLHPVVRMMDRLISNNCVDIRTYARLASTGSKFARVMLGADTQSKLSSQMLHYPRSINSYNSRAWISRANYTTTRASNRYNLYGKSDYSIFAM